MNTGISLTYGLILGFVAFTIPFRATADVTILLEGTSSSRDMKVTFNGTGWTTTGDSFNAFSFGNPLVANSSHDSVGGSHREGFADISVQGNPFKAAVSSGYQNGQYVPFDTPISFSASNTSGPTSFNIIGIVMDDDGTGNDDDLRVATDQPGESTTWPSGTTFGYTAGSSSTFSLDSEVDATFDEAFNLGSYTIDSSTLKGTLTISVLPDPPAELAYSTNPAIYTVDVAITNNEPSSTGGDVASYSITPALPAGLSLDTSSGVISGTPTELSAAADYTVTATNAGGSTTVTVRITVNDVALDIVAYWPLDEADGTNVADTVGSHNGSVMGTAEWKPGEGKFGGAIYFDGSDGFIEVPNASDFRFAEDESWAVSLWYKTDTTQSENQGLITKGYHDTSRSNDGYWLLRTDGSTFGFASRPGSGNTPRVQISSDSGIMHSDDQWHHFVVTRDGPLEEIRMYVDGQLTQHDASGTNQGMWAMGDNDDPLVIGNHRNRYTPGWFDDIAIWKGYALTDTDVTAISEGVLSVITEAPSALGYSANPAVYTVGVVITDNAPSSMGDAVVTYSISPALPAGLNLDTSSGVISGTPAELSAVTDYTVRATNAGGSTTTVVTITVNDVAPSALSYTMNPAIYTVDMAISDNVPSSGGGAVVTYSIAPALPAGLGLDTGSGVISGTPIELSAPAEYTVTATNSGGSATVSLRIAVNGVKHVVILLEGTDGSRDMRVTFNGTGSWTTSGSTVSAFTYDDSNVANSSNASLGGKTKEGFEDVGITGGNAMNAALSGSYTDGQYVAFATPIAMTAGTGPSSFNVIGLLFDDDSDPTAGEDDLILVTDQPKSSSWPSATEISYTVGASTTFSLDSGIGATFDQAFNEDIYTLDEGVVGSLKVGETAPPADLVYSTNPAIYTVDEAITDNVPSSTGSAVESYSITPALPAGLSLTGRGVISGTPTELSTATDYTVRATNAVGSTTASLRIAVNDVKHVVILLEGTDGSRDMRVTFNGTGSWTTSGSTVSAFTYGASNVANSSDASLGGSSKAGIEDIGITGGNAMKAALSGSYTGGQYVAFGTPIAMSADGGPSSFNVIGLLFDDDADPNAGQDDVILVTDQADTSSWPSATEISYTVGAYTTFSLDSGIGATFEEAFNEDIYTLDEGVVGSLKVAEPVAPVELAYSVNPAIYTVSQAITDNVPSSTGSAVDSYSITPALPTGLSLDTATGVISGRPSAASVATDYTVRATNTAGSATVRLRLTVNGLEDLVILLEGTSGSRDMWVTFNGTGWTTTGSTTFAFNRGAGSVANSSHSSLSGSTREGFKDDDVQGNPFKGALSSGKSNGQYVPFDTPISCSASNTGGPTSFNIIGLLMDDDGTGDVDDFRLVTDRPQSTTWPSGTTLSYTVGSSSTFSLDSGVDADFEEAMNVGSYTLGGPTLKGTLQIAVARDAPADLAYSTNSAIYTLGEAISTNVPSSSGGAVAAYSITPALPAGLSLDTGSGVISGTPAEPSAATDYTVTAANAGGSTTVTVSITVNDAAPSELSYATNPAIYTKDATIVANVPFSRGGAVVSYSVAPALPAGLSLDTGSGVISGTPTELNVAADYTVTATNAVGSVTVRLRIAVKDVKHVVILLEGTSGSRDMRVTFNGTGSWTTSGSTVSAFTHNGSDVANSSDASLGGSSKAGFQDSLITGGNAMNAALSGSFTGGQYVAFDTPIAMTADGGPSSFNVIGLLFDDDNDPTVDEDDVTLVTDQADTSSWPSATEISYTVGASATFSLDSGVGGAGATFNQAFNKDIYTLNDGVVGSLKIAEPMPPAELAYSVNPAIYTVGLAITDNVPSSTGSAVDSYSITPALPAGLSLDTGSGVISGTPSAASVATDYTVTATNAGGSATAVVTITVNDVALDVVALWLLDEADGTSVADAVGSHNGSVTGTAEWKPGEGKFGGAIYFDGSDGFIEVPNASDFRFAEDESWAVSLWYKTDTTQSENQGLITKGYHDTTRSGDGYWLLQARSGTFAFGSRPGSGSTPRVQISSDSGISPGDDQWHHFVVTRDGPLEEIRMYVDGHLTQHDASGTNQGMWAMGDNDDPLVIGNHFNRYTPGWFDDIAIWKGYALTDTDVTAISEGLLSVITEAPRALTYSANSAIYTKGVVITDNAPSSMGDAVVTYSISPALPAGLSLDTGSGVISGTPSALSAETDYTVTATNLGGSATTVVTITVNDEAPSALGYTTNPVVYTKGAGITNNTPSSGGGAVVTYSITPALPAGLSLDTGSGVISGTPTEPSVETDYTVRATNTGGSTTVTLRITVKVLVIVLDGTSSSRDMKVTFNGTGWTTTGDSFNAFNFGNPLVANSSHSSLSGSHREGFADISVQGNPFKAAVSSGYQNGQYVPFDTPISFSASNTSGPTSFNIIGLLMDDDGTGNDDDLRVATDQPQSTTWPSGTTFSYTAGSSSDFSLDSVVDADFDEAFNLGSYTIDSSTLKGTLTIRVLPDSPAGLAYTANPATYTVGVAITDNSASSTGGAVDSYSISPALPAGLDLDTASGVISGTPEELSAVTDYTVTATNTGGSATVTVSITVNDEAPAELSYATNQAVYTKGMAISDNAPFSTGGAVDSYSITPALPAGLGMDTTTGVISGTPAELSAVTDYTVRATNTGGVAAVTLRLTVNNLGPSALSYATNQAVYTVGTAITNNAPSSEGGAVVTYSIDPALPAGLSLDTGSGVISGTPSEPSVATDYTVRATNSGGAATVTLGITANDVAPSALGYTTNPAVYTKGSAITNNVPSSTGGAVVSYSIDPALSAGLSFDTVSGVISGTPSELSVVTDYTVRATNSGGSTTVKLRITVNDEAPGELSYATNPAVYTVGMTISDNAPSSTGGAVVFYSIDSALPAGLSLNPATGVISGTPSELSVTRDYTVRATNAGGSATVTLRITVNGLVILLEGTSGSRDMKVTFNGTGWTTTGGSSDAFNFGNPLVANSSHDGVGGSNREGFVDSGVQGDPFKDAVSSGYQNGQYVPFDTPIPFSASNTDGPTSFNIIGLVFDDDAAVDDDDLRVATDQPGESTSWAGGTTFSYTGGSSSTFSLDSGVDATFDEAFNPGSYRIDSSTLKGTLTIRVLPDPPAGLVYTANPATYTVGVTITDNSPSSTGGAVDSYTIDPALPAGLSLDVAAGVISGTPSEPSAATDYTVRATNSGGAATVTLRLTINDVAPVELIYAVNPAVYTVGMAIADNAPSSTGGAVVSYSIDPALPAGLSLDMATGVISGTPSELTGARDYTVRATNSGGSATVTLRVTVSDVAPAELIYAVNPAVYTVGMAISDNAPSSTGGAVMSYSIDPALPAGLSFDTATGVISGTPAEPSVVTDYTVRATNTGGSAAVTLRIAVNTATDVAPAELSYATNPSIYTVGVAITDNAPSSTGGAVLIYSIVPSLPAGLDLDTATGMISGVPSEPSVATDYTVRATNSGGSATVTLNLTVNDMAPAELSYAVNPAVYTVGMAISDNAPSSTGGAVVSYSIDPALPAGLSLDTGSGVISGTPSELTGATDYTVRATNSGGSAAVTLNLAVNEMAPAELSYAVNPAVYTVGMAISDNAPSSTGGAVVSYSIDPALPAGLSLDTATGVISGTPSALSAATDYTVRATNAVGSATVTLNLTVNDVAPAELSYAVNPAVYTVGMAISDNAPSSTGGAVVSYSIDPALPAGLSLDTGSGVISGTPSELSAATDYTVRATNSGGSATVTLNLTVNDVAPAELSYAVNPAVYTVGMAISDNAPSSTGGAVVSYSIDPALPAGLNLDTATGMISGVPAEPSVATDYTVGATNSGGAATVTLNLTVNDMAPAELSYAVNPAVYTVGMAISDNAPSSTGGAVVSYSIDPALPAGLSLDMGSGVISGTPSELAGVTDYTVRATNTGGSATVTLRLTVNDVAPAELSYAVNPAVYTVGMAISDNAPSSTGGAVMSYSIDPALPAGLSLDVGSGVISGTPAEPSVVIDYTVRATNSGGSAAVTLRIAVSTATDVAPAELSYATNPAIYAVGVAITDNAPSSTGGAVLIYSIVPSLPAGLDLDTATGVISGVPAEPSVATDYTVRATNSGGAATVTLNLTVNDMAPAELSYAVNPAVYTVGMAISDNAPSSTGGAVMSYSIDPALPAGLILDVGSGVISGTPSELTGATDYTVRATNSGGSAAVTLRITVNGLVILLEGTSGSRDMKVTFNGTGWTTTGDSFNAFNFGNPLVANSSHDGVGGSNREGFAEISVQGNPFKNAVSSGYQNGQYVPFDTPIPFSSSNTDGPTSFNIIGFVMDDDGTGDDDDFRVATDQPGESTTWASGTTFSYAGGSSSTFSLDSGVDADFDEAFNLGSYRIHSSTLKGTLTIRVLPDPPAGLVYTANPATYTVGVTITENSPSSTGGDVDSYSIDPALPAGLSLDAATGVISGTPSEPSAATDYTVRATNSGGSATVTLNLTVNDMAPAELSYAVNPAVYTVGMAISDNAPSSTGGAVVSYSIDPALPAGLSLDTGSGVISGTPSELTGVTDYTVRATNSGGSATVTLRLTVNDVAPAELSYAVNPAVYTVGMAISDNAPSSTGGVVVSYSIDPALPAGLSLDVGSGVISGTPAEPSVVTDYTVRATNSGGSAAVTLRIAVNTATDVAPAELSYATNPAIYTVGVAITDNAPSSTGGAVLIYSIVPSLPAGLDLDTATGMISGVPAEPSVATDYTVRATNSGGSATVTLRLTVNDVAPAELSYAVNPAVYTVGMAISDNAPSSTGGAVMSYSIDPALPAGLSLDTGSGVISGTPSALSAATDYTVRATNAVGSATVTLNLTVNDVAPAELSYAVNPAVYTVGMAISDNAPSSTGGAVVSYSIDPALPAGLSLDTGSGVISGTPSELSAATDYTVRATNSGGSATVTLRLTVNDVAPAELSYAVNPAVYTVGMAISDNAPSSTGGVVVSYSIDPALPAGLSLDVGSGVISGTPAEPSVVTDYTVRATNTGGSATVTLRIAVNTATDAAPAELSYATNPAIYTVGVAITDNAPSSTGGAVLIYSIVPSLPAGLDLDTATGMISGVPAEPSVASDYTVRATNSGGSATVTLNLTVNDMAPAELSYAVNPAVYTVGMAISDNAPSSTGGAVMSYSIDPALPAGLILDVGSGVISGTPSELTGARDYTVRATNSGGSAAVTLRITVNDLVILLEGTSGSRDMKVTFNGTGWTTTGDSFNAFNFGNPLVANSSHDGVGGSNREGFAEISVQGNPFKNAVSSGYQNGQYVPFDTPIPFSSSNTDGPTSFNIIGFVMDDDGTGDDDDFRVATDQPGESTTWASGTTFSYAGGSSSTFSLDSGVGATFGEAFNPGSYRIDSSTLKGTLTIRVLPDPPAGLVYTPNPATYTVGVTITENSPSSTGGDVDSYSIDPALPAGLSLDAATGVISGTPSELSAATDYTVRATNSGGSATVTLNLTVNDMAPAELSYAVNPAVYTVGMAISDNAPSSTGGAVVAYSIGPELPVGLSLDVGSGVISGTPSELTGATDYTVRATNSGGSATVTLNLTVNDMAPAELSYAVNPAVYTVGMAISDNAPSSTGGAVVAYSIGPELPVGLSLDTGSGVISGTPAELSEASDYTVTAMNTGGSAMAVVTITVKDMAPSALVYTVSPAIYPLGEAIADNMPSSTGGAVVAYSITPVLPAGLSFDPVSGVISGTPSELSAVTDYTVTATNTGGSTTVRVPITVTEAALTDVAPAELSYATNPVIYTMGVAIADNVPSSTGGAVVAYSITPSLPVGLSFDSVSGVISGTPLELSEAREYVVTAANAGGSTAVTVMITVNAMAPGELTYTTNPVIYTVDVAITDNVPSSTGGAVVAYVMAPSLPEGLSFDTKTGVISGMPAELSEASEYTVTATNSGGSATVTLRIAVNDVAPSALAYSVSPGIYPVSVVIADNMPSSTGGAVVAYSITPSLPLGLSFDPVSGVISGTPSELSAVTNYTVTAINSGGSTTVRVPITVTEAALTDVAPAELSYATNPVIYTMGVAIADNVPSSTGGAVVAYSITPSLPVGLSFDSVSGVISGTPLELSEAREYVVTAANAGGSTAVTVMITVNAMAPGELTYSTNPAIYTVGVAITDNVPSSTGGAVVAYSITPSLPAGLSFDTKTGVISGMPAELSEASEYTVTATNSGGSATVTLRITINDVAPSALAYSVSPGIYPVGVAIADNMPSSTGGAVVAYSITPVLPAGLSFDPVSGVISGTPSELSAVTDYTVTAINSGGSTTVRVPITVTDAALTDVAPAELSYATNPGIYTMGVAIADNVPSSTGGVVVAYSIAPSLPAGLSLDTVSGVISGTPAELSEARDYTVTAANAGGSTAVTLRITVNDMAPSALAYSVSPGIYPVGVVIADNMPSSAGGAVVAYSITPSLPAGLSFDPVSGVISGTPSELSAVTDYTVTATNTGGAATVTVPITVTDAALTDVAPAELSYATNPAIYTMGVAIADNVPSSTGGAVLAYLIAPSLPVGLSFDTGSGVISGVPSELSEARDYTVTAANSGGSATVTLRITVSTVTDMAPAELSYTTNPAIYTVGFAISRNSPFSKGGVVDSYSITPALPVGLSLDTRTGVISGGPAELSAARDYIVTATNSRGSTTATLRIMAEDAAPSALSYAMNPAIYTVGVAIAENVPSSTGGAVVAYSITPVLPAGLSLDPGSGVISGTPTELSAVTDYMVTATNSRGSTTATLRITVEDAAPSALSYVTNPAIYTVGAAIADNVPSSTGGAAVAYSTTPVLPAGLSLDPGSGVISGTPTEPAEAREYTVRATNSGGSATVMVRITVNDMVPSELTYSMNPSIYTVGEAIADNMPSSTGGAVVAYSITPVLPAGLSLDTGSGGISGTPTEPGEAREYTVTATNSGGSTTAAVTITVNGRHPQYTNSGPFNVAENSVTGTLAGDAAGGAKDVGVTYAVQSGNDSVDGDATPAFGLDPDTGVLTVRDQDDLDHETQSSFALVIRATDGDGFTDVIVTIQVDDVPEAPVSTGLTPVYVMIGATDSVIDLATVFSDEEDADLSYSISSNSNTELFTSAGIDEETDRLILDFAPNIAGAATLEITATDSDGQSVSASLVVTVSGDAVEEWRDANFSAADLGDPAKEATLWGNSANPDEDLWSNAFEFFFGTDPNSFDESYPMTYEVRQVGLDGFAVLEFERSKAMPAGVGVVEGSGDLSQWQVVNAPAVVMEDLGDRERVRVRVPLEEQAKQSFVRLVVDLGMN